MSQTSSSPQTNKPKSFSLIQQVVMVFGAGILVATLFTALTPVGLIAEMLAGKLPANQDVPALFPSPDTSDYPTPTPRPRPRIGIVAGHWGNDSGAVCSDGLTEEQVNLTVATLVKQQLVVAGYDVDLLQEFDSKLISYRALALVSIHADSCEYINDQATGFKVAAALSTTNTEKATRLTACIRSRYTAATGLSFHAASITSDMTSYHAFDEIHHDTAAAIIEVGFLNLDRQTLTQHPESVAEGISKGILCFIRNESVTEPPPEPAP